MTTTPPDELFAFVHTDGSVSDASPYQDEEKHRYLRATPARLAADQTIAELREKRHATNVLLLAIGGRSELVTTEQMYDGVEVVRQHIATLEARNAELVLERDNAVTDFKEACRIITDMQTRDPDKRIAELMDALSDALSFDAPAELVAERRKNEKLRDALEKAPHRGTCEAEMSCHWETPLKCNCWKAALAKDGASHE